MGFRHGACLTLSLGLSLLAFGLGSLIPLRLWAAPLWLLYALITGTVATGC
jgi:omega-6 fatty acid desaturase (delta-12 desaturase)